MPEQTGLSKLNQGAAVASAATITATGVIFHVTGTAEITTIHAPNSFDRSQIVIIPDAAFTTATGGNIGKASTGVVGKALTLTYDGTLWYPDY